MTHDDETPVSGEADASRDNEHAPRSLTETSEGADPDEKGPASKRARDEADGGDNDNDNDDDNDGDDENDNGDDENDNEDNDDEVNGVAAAKRPPKKKFKGEPQKPISAWHIYQKEKTAQIKADEEHKATSHAEQQKMVGGWWKAASAEEKAPYEAKLKAELEAFPALRDAWKAGLDEATLKEVEMEEEKFQAWEREQSRKKREAEKAKREKEAQKAYVKLQQQQQNLLKEALKKRKEQERLVKKAAKDKEKKDKAEKKEANKAAKDKAKAEKAAAAKASGPGASKKPAKAKSAYQHFSSEKRAELKDEYKEKHGEEWGKELTKEIKRRWEGLSEEDKAPYETVANQDRQRYEQEYTAWYENLDEEEMEKIEEEEAEKERAKEAKLRDRVVAKAHLLEDREDREAVSAPKPAKPAKPLELKGQPDGLTKGMVVEFMQTYIPTHYLLGETLAWRELIEPELRAAHGDLDWREIPDSSRNKNTLLRSMKAIWKEIGGDSQLPTDLDEIPLEPAVAAKLAKLEAYIEKRIEIVAASKRSEKEGEAAADLDARGEIELRTKKLEKYACEACLAWWCLRTGKPSLNSLGTEAKLEQFIAGQIQKRWFPRGKPGKEDVDWEGKKQDGDRLIESKTKWKPIVPKSTQKLQAVVENGSIVWKMVDVPQDVDEAEVKKRRLEEEREAAELNKERDELEEKLRASYALQIGANLREFLKAWKSVNETKLNTEVMEAFGLAWGARTGKSADDDQLDAEDAASWWEG